MVDRGQMNQPAEQEAINVPLEHVGIEDASLIFANHFLAQAQQDEITLLFAQVSQPMITGTPQEQMEQLRAISSVKAHVVARFVFTRARLDELITVLVDIRRNADQSRGGGVE